jgi:peptidoglycan/LPS O-acetylase OafA/YrhL
MCFTLLFFSPRVPNASFLKQTAVGGMIVGSKCDDGWHSLPRQRNSRVLHLILLGFAAAGIISAVAVGSAWIAFAFAGFVATAFYQTAVTIFPYAVVGVLGKEMQTSAHGFNNNGLYIGVLTLFASLSELTVRLYGTEDMAPLGTGNVLALPCILFVAGVACTAGFSFGFKTAVPQSPH